MTANGPFALFIGRDLKTKNRLKGSAADFVINIIYILKIYKKQ